MMSPMVAWAAGEPQVPDAVGTAFRLGNQVFEGQIAWREPFLAVATIRPELSEQTSLEVLLPTWGDVCHERLLLN